MPSRGEVVAVHGLWNRGPELFVLRRNLERALGLPVAQFRYSTMDSGLDEVVEALGEFVAARPGPEVHLVGHSLGGLLVLNALLAGGLPRGRAVLLGAPVNGSAAAAGAARWPFAPRLVGSLLPEALERAPYPAPVDRDVGSIAGDVGVGVGRLVCRFAGPSDGTVAVAETKLPDRPHYRLRATHTGLLFSREAAEAAARFLRSGRFVP